MPLLLAIEDDPDDDIVIANECHMIAQSDDAREVPPRSTPTSARAGPAWSATATRSPISSSCLAFTTNVIDTDLSHYTAERVVAIKRAHEAKILASRPAAQQQRDAIELRYAAIVEVWATRINLDSWEGLMTRGG
jgi:hypothetical protein